MTSPTSPETPCPSTKVSMELNFVPPNHLPSTLIARGTAPESDYVPSVMLINSVGVPIALSFAFQCGTEWIGSIPSVSLPDLYRVLVQSEGWRVEQTIALPALRRGGVAASGGATFGPKCDVSIETITCDPCCTAPTKVNVTGQATHFNSSITVMILLESTGELIATGAAKSSASSLDWRARFANIGEGAYQMKAIDEFGSSGVQPFLVPCSPPPPPPPE